LGGDFVAAIAVFREVVNIDRWLNRDSEDVATDLNTLAGAEYAAGDLDAAERDFREALRIARLLNYRQVISSSTGNLAGLALVRGNWTGAEALASEALAMAQGVGKRESIALNSHRLASALVRQGKKSEALPHANRAVGILTRLGSPSLARARATLAECESEQKDFEPQGLSPSTLPSPDS